LSWGDKTRGMEMLGFLDFPKRVFQGWGFPGWLDCQTKFFQLKEFVRIVSILGMGEVVVHSLCFAVVAFMYANLIF